MKVLAINAQKGGVGKSTIAQHIAVLAHKSGKKTAIIDFDPQGSSLNWATRRQARGITEPAVGHAGKRLKDALKAAKDDGFDLVVLDTPPNVESSVVEASKAADLILILACPEPKAIDAVGATAHLVEKTGKPAYLLLNMGRGAGINQDALRMLGQEYGLATVPVAITRRTVIMDADMDGSTLLELKSKAPSVKKGQAEFKGLWKWLSKQLGGKTHG